MLKSKDRRMFFSVLAIAMILGLVGFSSIACFHGDEPVIISEDGEVFPEDDALSDTVDTWYDALESARDNCAVVDCTSGGADVSAAGVCEDQTTGCQETTLSVATFEITLKGCIVLGLPPDACAMLKVDDSTVIDTSISEVFDDKEVVLVVPQTSGKIKLRVKLIDEKISFDIEADIPVWGTQTLHLFSIPI